jgi:putative FmdB family regulatory protein
VPLYEYQCGQCGRFEIIQKFSDSPLATCPRCGGEVQKLLSAPAIQFKGTGWYVTDYARKSSGGDGKSKDGNGSGKKEGGAGTESGSSGSSGTTKEPSSSSAGGTTK